MNTLTSVKQDKIDQTLWELRQLYLPPATNPAAQTDRKSLDKSSDTKDLVFQPLPCEELVNKACEKIVTVFTDHFKAVQDLLANTPESVQKH